MANADILSWPIVKWAVKNMTEVDSSYVEKSHYDWTVRARYKTTQEFMDIETDDGMKVEMKSQVTHKVGPNISWRFLSAGISYDFSYKITDPDRKKEEWGVSAFSQMFNIDLVYRRTGGDYSIRNLTLPYDEVIGHNPFYLKTDPEYNDPNYKISDFFVDFLNDSDISGTLVKSTTIGANGYYVFNHKRFSYPAAWSKGARQKISVGSPLAGFGYTSHQIENDFHIFLLSAISLSRVNEILENKPLFDEEKAMKSSNLFTRLNYSDYTFWGGYAYNWVPSRNFIVGLSGTVGLGVKHMTGDNFKFVDYIVDTNASELDPNKRYPVPDRKEYSETMLDFNTVWRLSLGWNNDRFLAGGRGSVNYFRYHNGNSPLKTDHVYWGGELYFGVKFVESKYWKEKKKRQNPTTSKP